MLSMVKAHNEFKIEKESFESMNQAGRFNPGLQVRHADGMIYPIGAGYSDYIALYLTGGGLYVLSENTGLEYIGMEVFDLASGEKTFDIFFDQSEDYEIMESMADVEKIEYMLQWA